jgi:NAD(P)-dependent dehydrogenase (short-subunit alcohol dehydrogenase family)
MVGGGSIGSGQFSTETIANLAQNVYTVDVSAGTTSLRATIARTSDRAADLDLLVFNAAGVLRPVGGR